MSDILRSINPAMADLLLPPARAAVRPLRQRREPAPYVNEEEERSLAGRLRDKSLTTIGAVGNLLDLPGSMVRDVGSSVAQGKFVNPFDQLLSPLSGDNRTTGRDLNRQLGFAGQKDTWGNAIGGFATEVLADPLTYMTFGASALGKSGQAAKAAGLTDDLTKVAARKLKVDVGQVGKRQARIGTTLNDFVAFGDDATKIKAQRVIDQGKASGKFTGDDVLGGLMGFGAPFMNPRGVVGTGAAAMKTAEVLDDAGRAVRFAKLPGTDLAPVDSLARAFDATIGGAKSAFGQATLRAASRDKEKITAVAKGRAIKLGETMRGGGLDDEAFGDVLRAKTEGITPADIANLPADMQLRYNDATNKINAIPGGMALLDSVAVDLKAYNASIASRKKAAGVKIENLDDDHADYMQRYIASDLGLKPQRDGRIMSTFDPSQNKRIDEFRNIPGGTYAVKEMLRDPEVRKLKDEIKKGTKSSKDLEGYLVGKNSTWLSDVYKVYDKKTKVWTDQKMVKVKTKDPQTGIVTETETMVPNTGRYKALVNKMLSLQPETLELGLFGNHPLIDAEVGFMAGENAIKAADNMLDALSQPEILREKSQALLKGGNLADFKSVRDIIKEAGLKYGNKKDAGFIHRLRDSIGRSGDKTRDIGNLLVDRKHSDDLLKMMEMGVGQEPVRQWLEVVDGMTNFGKGMWTSVWPAFHTRNFVSGTAHNFLKGIVNLRSMWQTWKYATGGTVNKDDLLKNDEVVRQLGSEGYDVSAYMPKSASQAPQPGGKKVTDADVTRVFREMIYSHGTVGKFEGNAVTVAGQTSNLQGGSFGDMMTGVVRPGQSSLQPARVARKFMGMEPETTINPAKATVRGGLTGATDSTFGPSAAGEEVGNFVELMNRAAPFYYLLTKNFDPAEAAKQVGNAQVQYSNRNFTAFEQQVMKRLMPFYSFTKGIVPEVAKEIAQRPGGRLATTVKAQNRSQGDGELAPDYVRDTASVPIDNSNPLLQMLAGKPPEGTDRYLTGLGLMHEDAFSFGPSVRGAMLEVGSRMNPFLKAPAEWATGQTFFQRGPEGGRDLDRLDPTVGRFVANVMGQSGQDDSKKFPLWMEHIVANSPVARLASTARSITDPRKRWDQESEGIAGYLPGPASLLNTLSGVRITDVSPGSKDAILRELLNSEMEDAGASVFERIYFSNEEKAKMSPQARDNADKLQGLANVLAKRAKERKAIKVQRDAEKAKRQ